MDTTDALVLVMLVAVSIVLWLARAHGGITIDDLLQRTDQSWPHGVQEEDPVRWHPERLHPRPR